MRKVSPVGQPLRRRIGRPIANRPQDAILPHTRHSGSDGPPSRRPYKTCGLREKWLPLRGSRAIFSDNPLRSACVGVVRGDPYGSPARDDLSARPHSRFGERGSGFAATKPAQSDSSAYPIARPPQDVRDSSGSDGSSPAFGSRSIDSTSRTEREAGGRHGTAATPSSSLWGIC